MIATCHGEDQVIWQMLCDQLLDAPWDADDDHFQNRFFGNT